jgi:hypothetical protein
LKPPIEFRTADNQWHRGVIVEEMDHCYAVVADLPLGGRWSIFKAHADGWRWPEIKGGDPSVTHGKNGVPPLEVVPEPRRCAGAPGCVCDAVLGPVDECPGDLCAHCENLLKTYRLEELAAEDGFVDCDACNPDRLPKSGKLCGRCQAVIRRRDSLVDMACKGAATDAVRTLRVLVHTNFLTADEAQGIQCATDTVLRVLRAELAGMTERQEVCAAVVIRDALNAVLDIRREPAREALGVRS